MVRPPGLKALFAMRGPPIPCAARSASAGVGHPVAAPLAGHLKPAQDHGYSWRRPVQAWRWTRPGTSASAHDAAHRRGVFQETSSMGARPAASPGRYAASSTMRALACSSVRSSRVQDLVQRLTPLMRSGLQPRRRKPSKFIERSRRLTLAHHEGWRSASRTEQMAVITCAPMRTNWCTSVKNPGWPSRPRTCPANWSCWQKWWLPTTQSCARCT